jgi:2-(1,2-epoxy-1,2-dihydrophenyl)acetyl-CoA isomerase
VGQGVTSETYDTILVSVDGPIATLTLHRPDRMNAMTNRMVSETFRALTALAADRSVRVLVLTGSGRSFCPGADIGRIAGDADRDDHLEPTDFNVPVLLHEMPAVTIAAINGACAGAALGWACACDLRLAARSARFNTAFLDVGVAGDMGGPWTLSRLVGPAKARELYFLPDKFDAAEALRIGLVARVCDDDQLTDEVKALTARLAAAAPIALRTLKANFVESERMDFASFVALETERHMRMFTTHDTREAFAAKAEKRPPQFEGR